MRVILDNLKISSEALKSMGSFYVESIKEIEHATQTNQYVIIGMKHNPYVKYARNLLTQNNITYKYIEHGSYFSKWRQRLAIKLWSGWPTFPMVFVDEKLIGGFNELKTYFENKR